MVDGARGGAGDRVEARGRTEDSTRLAQDNGLGSLTVRDLRAATTNNSTAQLHAVTIEDSAQQGPGTVAGASSDATRYSPTRFARAANDVFRDIDRNDDGVLTGEELNRASHDRRYTGERLQAVSALNHLERGIRDANFDLTLVNGITRADLEQFGKPASASRLSNLNLRIELDMARTANAANRPAEQLRLYASENPLESIRPDAINVGNRNDGNLESVLISMAQSNPAAIRNMIRENADGSFTVTFPGDSNHPIRVERPNPTELAIYRESTNRGIWPDIMMSAFGDYMNRHGKVRVGANPFNQDFGDEYYGDSQNLLRLMTGRDSHRNGMFENLSDNLTAAFRDHRAVVARNDVPFINGYVQRTPDGYLNAHNYAVVGWDAQGANGGTVTIRDPRAGSNARDLRISLETFRANFNTVDFEGSRAVTRPRTVTGVVHRGADEVIQPRQRTGR